jgi:hypothetical protein
MEEGEGYELFAVYGISMEYPSSWSVEIGPLKRDQGSVSFRSKHGECSCELTWTPLKEVQKRFRDSREQARKTLDNFKSRSHVEDLEVLEDRSLLVNGHEAAVVRLRAVLKTGIFSRGRLKSEIQVLYLHCDETQRCFVLLSFGPQEDKYANIFSHMVYSIKCH